MVKKKYLIASLILVILLTIITVLYFTSPKIIDKNETIKIGYQETSLYQHIFVTIEKGFFTEEKINAELIPFKSANQMMQALITGDIDVLGLTNLQVALTVEGKEKNKFKFINFLVWDQASYPDYIICKKENNIFALSNLLGKTIGLHPGSAVKAFATTILKLNNIDVSQINMIELEPSLMQSSLLSNNVQAVYCMDPVATNLINSGECEVIISNPMKYIFPSPTPISGTAVSYKISQNQEQLKNRITRAINKGIDYTRNPNNQEEVFHLIEKYTPTKFEILKKMNPSEFWKSNEIDIERVQQLADKFFALGIVDKQIKVNEIIAE